MSDAPPIVSERVGRLLELVPESARSWPFLRRWYWQEWQLAAVRRIADQVAEDLEWDAQDDREAAERMWPS